MTTTNESLVERLATKGQIFSNGRVYSALRDAQRFVSEEGFIASMPFLVQARIQATEDTPGWPDGWISALSEENLGIDYEGKFGKKGAPLIVTVHGDGVFASYERAKDYGEVMYGRYPVLGEVFEKLLEGQLPSGRTIPIHHFDDFKNMNDLPMCYGVVIEPDSINKTLLGPEADKIAYYTDPLAITRCGGIEAARQYYEKEKENSKLGYVINGNDFCVNSVIDEAHRGHRGDLLEINDNRSVSYVGIAHLRNCGGQFLALRTNKKP